MFNEISPTKASIDSKSHIHTSLLESSGYPTKYKSVWAAIDTGQETLSIHHELKPVEKFDYPLPKTYIELLKIGL